jgi:hypothetical protein
MEGVSTDPDGLPRYPRFPRDASDEELRFLCIIDPIDGTRSLMHDKRSAWVLSALAPWRSARHAIDWGYGFSEKTAVVPPIALARPRSPI